MAVSSAEKIELIKKACPICKGDVRGNDVYLYFCKRCKILYKREELLLNTPEQIHDAVKKSVVKKYVLDKENLDIEKSEFIKEKLLTDKQRTLLDKKIPHQDKKQEDKQKNFEKPKEIYYFASKKSDVVHANNCPYAKNIKISNRIRFEKLSDAKNYRKCSCITTIS